MFTSGGPATVSRLIYYIRHNRIIHLWICAAAIKRFCISPLAGSVTSPYPHNTVAELAGSPSSPNVQESVRFAKASSSRTCCPYSENAYQQYMYTAVKIYHRLEFPPRDHDSRPLIKHYKIVWHRAHPIVSAVIHPISRCHRAQSGSPTDPPFYRHAAERLRPRRFYDIGEYSADVPDHRRRLIGAHFVSSL